MAKCTREGSDTLMIHGSVRRVPEPLPARNMWLSDQRRHHNLALWTPSDMQRWKLKYTEWYFSCPGCLQFASVSADISESLCYLKYASSTYVPEVYRRSRNCVPWLKGLHWTSHVFDIFYVERWHSGLPRKMVWSHRVHDLRKIVQKSSSRSIAVILERSQLKNGGRGYCLCCISMRHESQIGFTLSWGHWFWSCHSYVRGNISTWSLLTVVHYYFSAFPCAPQEYSVLVLVY